jgi:hypothetical protein
MPRDANNTADSLPMSGVARAYRFRTRPSYRGKD